MMACNVVLFSSENDTCKMLGFLVNSENQLEEQNVLEQ